MFLAIEEHPVKRMLSEGLRMTVNSEDPAYFGGYVADNYAAVRDGLGFCVEEFRAVAENSFLASFLDEGERGVGGLRGGAAGAAYTASKHGLIGLTKNTAANYAADGIRCIAICPGGVDTGISPGGEPSERGYATLNRVLPAMGRLAGPAEIAEVALFCASDEASFLNGAVIVADGGWTAH